VSPAAVAGHWLSVEFRTVQVLMLLQELAEPGLCASV
jgi:hypothetical protein